jgi:hypothetical protein
LVLCLCLPWQLAAQPRLLSIDIDWRTGLIQATIELNLVAAGIRLPSGRSEAEQSIAWAIPHLVKPSITAILVDSYRTVADTILDGSLNPIALQEFLESGKRHDIVMSPDMRNMRSNISWRLPDLAMLYVNHSMAAPLPEADRYVPTRAYTGVIIYAQGLYPVRGEHRPGSMQPTLFPRLYDEDMNTILARNSVDPAAIASWGLAGYVTTLNDPAIEIRAGDDPLRLMAYQIFGTGRTDAVITRTDALRILNDPVNRQLIRQCRIVFVIDETSVQF